jgi:hypothetical protein
MGYAVGSSRSRLPPVSWSLWLDHACDDSPVLRTLTEERVRDGVTYRAETTWDDKTGNAQEVEVSRIASC